MQTCSAYATTFISAWAGKRNSRSDLHFWTCRIIGSMQNGRRSAHSHRRALFELLGKWSELVEPQRRP